VIVFVTYRYADCSPSTAGTPADEAALTRRMFMNGMVVNSWPYVIAAYAVTWAVILGTPFASCAWRVAPAHHVLTRIQLMSASTEPALRNPGIHSRNPSRKPLAIAAVVVLSAPSGIWHMRCRGESRVLPHPSELVARATRPSTDRATRRPGRARLGAVECRRARPALSRDRRLEGSGGAFHGRAAADVPRRHRVVVEGKHGRSGVFESHSLMVKHSNEYRAPTPGDSAHRPARQDADPEFRRVTPFSDSRASGSHWAMRRAASSPRSSDSQEATGVRRRRHAAVYVNFALLTIATRR